MMIFAKRDQQFPRRRAVPSPFFRQRYFHEAEDSRVERAPMMIRRRRRGQPMRLRLKLLGRCSASST